MNCPECNADLGGSRQDSPTVEVVAECTHNLKGVVNTNSNGHPQFGVEDPRHENMVGTRMVSVRCLSCEKFILQGFCGEEGSRL
jgi:hypothetical protein